MSDIDIIVCLLPMVFMVHELEEITGLKTWLDKNGEWPDKKFPVFKKQVQGVRCLSVEGFAVAVSEEYLIVCIVTLTALIFQWYYVWIAVFMAFSFHIVVHIVQWIIAGRYIPMIITSLFSVPYIIWGMVNIVCLFTVVVIVISFIAGIVVAVLNLSFAHKLAYKFDRYINNK